MASFNKVILIGNMTADPELNQTASGMKVCSFSIAVNRKGKDAGVDFLNVVAWRERAEFVAKFFKKGRPILVCGQLQTRAWTDKQGNKHTEYEVIADEIAFVTPAEQVQHTESASFPDPTKWGRAPADYGKAPDMEEINDGDLPF